MVNYYIRHLSYFMRSHNSRQFAKMNANFHSRITKTLKCNNIDSIFWRMNLTELQRDV